MRTLYALAWILALGMVTMMLSMSGFWGAVGLAEDPHASADALNESGKKYNPDEGIEGGAAAENDGNIVGMILSGGSAAMGMLGKVALIQWELMDMGFPAWFALPVGTTAQIIAFWGGTQFIIGRVMR